MLASVSDILFQAEHGENPVETCSRACQSLSLVNIDEDCGWQLCPLLPILTKHREIKMSVKLNKLHGINTGSYDVTTGMSFSLSDPKYKIYMHVLYFYLKCFSYLSQTTRTCENMMLL